ncbi:MAG: hypothetical protein ACK6CT_14190 [Planctomycetia bacterium]|jgi:hypothetical protein
MMRGCFLALALACWWQAAPADEPVLLRYRYRLGDRIDMQVAHRALTETTMNGVSQMVETQTDSTKTCRVIEVGPAGRATLEFSVDGVTMISRTSDKGEVRWASGGRDEPPPGYEGVPQNLGVPLTRIVIDTDGRVVGRHDLRPCPPAATGDLVIVPLPERAVSPGAEWTVPQELVIEAPESGRKAVRVRLRYRLDAVRNGVATIKVDTTVLTPIDDPRLESRLLERIWDGTIAFDVEEGRVISRSTAIDRRIVGFGGPQSSVRYKASQEERLTR